MSTAAVDREGVTFFGSAGVRCLVDANRAARQADVAFVVHRPWTIVDTALTISGVGKVLQIVRS